MDFVNGTLRIDDQAPSLVTLGHNLYIQAVVTVVAVCLCTRVLSSHRFTLVKHDNGRDVEPPTLPYWFPFLKHAFSMAWDSKQFTARCL
jgi:hypothetical protein